MITPQTTAPIAATAFLLMVCSCCCPAHAADLADNNWWKGLEMEKQAQHLKAAKLFEQSLEYERTLPAPRQRVVAVKLERIGRCYYQTGHYSKAHENFSDALTIMKTLGQEAPFVA